VMVVKIMKFGPFQLHLTPGSGWKSSPKCVVLVCSPNVKKITNRWREIGCNEWKVQSFWSVQKMFLGALNFYSPWNCKFLHFEKRGPHQKRF
jgi:hypothetical protein